MIGNILQNSAASSISRSAGPAGRRRLILACFYYYNTSGSLVNAFTWKPGVPSGSGGDTQISSLEGTPYTSDTVTGGIVWSAPNWNKSNAFTIIRGF